MTKTLGKVSREFFNQYIMPKLGALRPEVLVPPQNGVDVAIVQLSKDRVMAITTDPVYIVPAYGWEKAAWFAFHIIASDLCTSGLAPEYMSIDLNLPVGITDDQFKRLWNTIDIEAKKYRVAIVTGHTARYEGTDYPMLGGATMFGTGPIDRYITATMAKTGDLVIVTKTIALEATAIFSHLFPEHIESMLGTETLKKAQQLFYKMSTVEEALEASKFGLRDNGITAMHDATEGGILGALYEIAEASNHGIFVEKEKIPIYAEVQDITELFGMNPYRSISEGTLVLTVKKDRAEAFIKVLTQRGINAVVVGEITDKKSGKILYENKQKRPLPAPEKDDFWEAISKAVKQQLK